MLPVIVGAPTGALTSIPSPRAFSVVDEVAEVAVSVERIAVLE